MKFEGTFKDINDILYTVTINTPETGEDVELVFGANPVTISWNSTGLFAPIKSREASIEIVTKKYYFSLYNPKSRECSVIITRGEGNEEEVIFYGYLTPNSYNQDYSYIDTVTINAVDAISTAKDFSFTGIWNNLSEYLNATNTSQQTVNGGSSSDTIPDWETMYGQFNNEAENILYGIDSERVSELDLDYVTFHYLITVILRSCGYTGNIYTPDTFTKINGKDIENELDLNNIIEGLYCASSNFFDNDAAHTPWNQYDVISELVKFLGWSIIPDGNDIWCVDYRSLDSKDDITYSIYDIATGEFLDKVTIPYTSRDISLYKSSGTPSLSIDDIYNKIELNANLYEIDSLAPDVFDDSTHISVTEEIDGNENGHQWFKTKINKFLWWVTGTTKTITGYSYQTICRLAPKTNFTHHFYRHNSLNDVEINNDADPTWKGKNYYDTLSSSNYINDKINKYCNTHGCLMQHYAYRPEEGANNLPTTLDWTDILTFFVVDDTTPEMHIADLPKLEKPVLEYNVNEEINFKPASGVSWITIQGDLFYQYNGVNYNVDKDNFILDIINTDDKWYCTIPVDKSCPDIKDKKLYSFYRDYNTYKDTFYGLGFGMWKMRVQIGDKYWYDYWDTTQQKYISGWTSTPSDFYIRYNNNPANQEEEFIPSFTWMSVASNTDFKDKVGVDGYCIPIDSSDPNAPTFGKLHITIYTPCLVPQEIHSYFSLLTGGTFSWQQIPPVIYAKNFNIGYVYTDDQVWYKQHKRDNGRDRVYTAIIDNGNVKEFDNIEFKLNTMLKNQPISRSYVTTSDGYLNSIEHKYGTLYTKDGQIYKEKTHEWNVVDQYLDHHSERKPIYDAAIHGYWKPYEIFNYGRYLLAPENSQGIQVPYNLYIDRQSFDCLKNKNEIHFIAY